jgi:hypothetical protein
MSDKIRPKGHKPKNIIVKKLQDLIVAQQSKINKMGDSMKKLEDLMISRNDEKKNMEKWHNDWTNLYNKHVAGSAFIESLKQTIEDIIQPNEDN